MTAVPTRPVRCTSCNLPIAENVGPGTVRIAGVVVRSTHGVVLTCPTCGQDKNWFRARQSPLDIPDKPVQD